MEEPISPEIRKEVSFKTGEIFTLKGIHFQVVSMLPKLNGMVIQAVSKEHLDAVVKELIERMDKTKQNGEIIKP